MIRASLMPLYRRDFFHSVKNSKILFITQVQGQQVSITAERGQLIIRTTPAT